MSLKIQQVLCHLKENCVNESCQLKSSKRLLFQGVYFSVAKSLSGFYALVGGGHFYMACSTLTFVYVVCSAGIIDDSLLVPSLQIVILIYSVCIMKWHLVTASLIICVGMVLSRLFGPLNN